MNKPIKTPLVKLCFLIVGLMVCNFLMADDGVTQDLNKTIIPIQLKNASLKQAFRKIESETKLLFTFKTKDVNAYDNISYSSPGIAVAKLLNDLLRETDLQYEQMDNNIIIKKISLAETLPQIPDLNPSEGLFEGGIRGKVTDDKGQSIGSASVFLSNSKRGSAANTQGEFSLNGLKAGTYTIQISAVGFITQSRTVDVTDNQITDITIVMQPDNSTLSDVVVTALGIKRSVRSLGYASQEVTADELTASHQPNLVNALQGKVAGVTISSAGGGPGQGATILIRGVNSLDPNKNNQPLFVVDGIPIDNTTSDLGTTGARGVQMSNRAADINPDDIESINVLRGGAATALYGLRGSNGVIVITTKSAKAGTFRVNYSGGYSIDQGDKFPDVQKTYTQGWHGVYDTTSFWPTWGPTVSAAKAIDPTHPDQLFDQYKHAYVTGHQFRNTLSMSGGTDRASLASSVSYSNQTGVLPFTWYKDVSARISGRLKFSDKLNMGADILYANTNGNMYDADRFNEEMSYWSPRWDVRDYKKPDGTVKEYPAYNGNAWFKAATNKFISDVSHTIASAYATWSPLTWFSATYRFGVDQYNDNRSATAPGYQGLPDEIIDDDNEYGFVGKYDIFNRQLNSNLVLTFDHKWGKLGTTLRLGNDVFDTKRTENSVRGDTLDVYNLFDLSNARKIVANNTLTQYRIVGAYGELALSYDDYLFLSITGRNDWTSTLEADNRSFFYPSASLSYIFTQQFKTLPSWFNYGKFRASLAGIGKDATPYSTSVVYIPEPDIAPINGVNQWTRSNAGGIASLKPEFTTTFEIGTDLSFFNNRLGFGFTWYKSNSRDQIIPVATAPSTGFTSITLNAGSIENKGIEITLNAKPVVTKDFNWNIGFNLSHNVNKVISIYGGLTELTVGSQYGYSNASVTMKYIPGESVGDIFGTPWSRYYDASHTEDPIHPDKSRPLLIGSNGFPLLTPSSNQKILGNSYPKWVAGINNSFSYKSFTLSFLFDGHFDVQKYDQLNNFMAAFGIAKYTENRNQTITFDGVLADGTKNTKPVWLGQDVGPDGVDYGDGYYRKVYRGISENFVEDASFIKLRTLTLTYNLNPKWLTGTFVKAASVGFT
ncbi:MAG TPA: SusC/RagA family TonB-linked outer membrane protein, partial [Puia sp.]|nr:SusC/RagA family TonB-linked outer membrane protein [Puia sp.]